VLHAARWKYRTDNDAKNRHLRTIAQLCRTVPSQLRHVSSIGENLFYSTFLRNMANFGPLKAEIGSGVWVTSADFNGFASCLRYCSSVAHRRPTKLCTMFGRLLHWYSIHLRGLLPRDRILSGAKFTLRPSLAFAYISSVTARHSSSWRQPNCGVVRGMELRNFRRRRHLYSAGRPSRWASAHILVI